MEKIWKTFETACLVQGNQFILGESSDYYKERDVAVSVIGSYNPNKYTEDGIPWWAELYKNWTIVSVCLWPHQASAIDFRCVLSEEGQVNIYGPGGKPDVHFQLPDAGVFREGATGYGYVQRIRAIGQGLYVCGANRQVYRYQAGASDPLQGSFIDVAGSMRQPPLPPAPEGDDLAAFSAWVDDHTSILFNDIAGCDEADIYVTGDETWHFDGKDWQAIPLKLTDEAMHVIKIIDRERIVIGGDNGYLFMGNARTGFTNLSSVDDNQTITGLEWFNQRLFIASDKGLFIWDEAQQKIIPYSTGLVPELQDAHLLEAKDGVLWSFGYKDLAYLDTREGGGNWVRVHHPDNPRIGDTPIKKKRRRKSSDEAAQEAALVAAAQAETLALLPAAPGKQDQLDIGGLMARVGHVGVGEFICTQLLAFGCKANSILKINRNKRYTVSVPHQGVDLVLQYTGNAKPSTLTTPEDWGLAELTLHTRYASADHHWRGEWLQGFDPYSSTWLEQVRQAFGQEDVATKTQASFTVRAPYGAVWMMQLDWTNPQQHLLHMKLQHLGDYLPWPAKTDVKS